MRTLSAYVFEIWLTVFSFLVIENEASVTADNFFSGSVVVEEHSPKAPTFDNSSTISQPKNVAEDNNNALPNTTDLCKEDRFYSRKESILNYFIRMQSCDILENTNRRMEMICRNRSHAHNEYYNVTYLAACAPHQFKTICHLPNAMLPWKNLNQSAMLDRSFAVEDDKELIKRSCRSVMEFLEALADTPTIRTQYSGNISYITFTDMLKISGEIPKAEYSEWYIPTYPFCRDFACGGSLLNHSSDETSVYDCMPQECKGTLVFIIVFDAVLAILIIVANSLVLGVAARTKIMRNVPGYFKISLALADLFVGIFILPCCIYTTHKVFLSAMPYRGPDHIQSIEDYITMPVAAFISFFFVISFAVSVYTMAIASVDRYLAITKPFRYRQGHYLTKRRSICAFLLIWLVGFFIAIFPVMSGERYAISAFNVVTPVGVNSSIVYAVTLFIPLLAVWSLNSAMLKQVCADRDKRSSIRASTVICNSPINRTANHYIANNNNNHNDVLTGQKAHEENEESAVAGNFSMQNIPEGPSQKRITARNASTSSMNYQKNGSSDRVFEKKKNAKSGRFDRVFQNKVLSRRPVMPSIKMNVERRLARTLAIMIGAFSLALLPAIATLIAYVVLSNDQSSKTINQLASATYLASRVIFSNSFWNCIIYSIRNRHFRRAMWAIFLCKKTKIDRKLRESISMSQWKRRSAGSSSDKQSLSKTNSTTSSSNSYRKDHRRSTQMWSLASYSSSSSRKGSAEKNYCHKDVVARTASCTNDFPKSGILKQTVERSESAPHAKAQPLPRINCGNVKFNREFNKS